MNNQRARIDEVTDFLRTLEKGMETGIEWVAFKGGRSPASELAMSSGWAVEPEKWRGEWCFQITDLGLSFLYLDRAREFLHAAESIPVESASDVFVRARLEEHRDDLLRLSALWSSAVTAKKPERTYR